MSVLKDKAIEIIKKLPDNCSVDDIIYEVYFISQVIEGLKEANEGKLIEHKKIKSEIDQWQG
ncbi:MAG: hypothetical protein AB1652_06220 [Bacillota bacterium]